MSFRVTAFRRCHLTVFFLGLTTLSLLAQAANSPIVFNSTDAITTTFVPAPFVNIGSSSSSSTNSQWLKIEFHYSITLPDGSPTFLDTAQFKIWVEGIDLFAKDAANPGDGVAVALTGTVDYVNLPVSKDVYGSFYIPPNTLARYSKTTSDFDRKFNVHVEAYVGGTLMDLIDKNKEQDPDWFKKLRAVSGMVYRQNECPFMLADPDRYPPIKPPSGATATP